MVVTYDVLKEAVKETITYGSIYMPLDVVESLKNALKREKNDLAKKQLEAILLNIKLAAEERKPICQDTGMMIFYVEAGIDFPNLTLIPKAITEAVREATKEIPLRPNAVDPIRNKNTGDNTGAYMPWIDWDLVEGDKLKITFLAKGGGSEYPTVLRMIPPAEGIRGVKKTVINAVFEAGAKPCPPVILGVGIAGASDVALKLAKKALLRPIGARHSDPEVAKLENDLLNLVNKIGIGPHGFGGETTALDVKVEYGVRHPASFAVAVTFMCWASRRATVIIDKDGTWKITSKHYVGGEI